MLLQTAPPGTVYYQPPVWPSNGEVETQPDPKFYQPMEWTYGPQAVNGVTSTSEQINTDNNNKSIIKTRSILFLNFYFHR